MREEKVTQEDALEIRKLLSFPGGLELHIGVGLGAEFVALVQWNSTTAKAA